jgi:hypothetical protein
LAEQEKKEQASYPSSPSPLPFVMVVVGVELRTMPFVIVLVSIGWSITSFLDTDLAG